MNRVFRYYNIGLLLILCLLTSCGRQVQLNIVGQIDEMPQIFPDYQEVTIPANIAPLNFSVDFTEPAGLVIEGSQSEVQVEAVDGCFEIPSSEWRQILEENKGGDLTFTVCRKDADGWKSLRPFNMHVAAEPIDPYVAYRLIPPGYELWQKMGIYQRNLETYDQYAIYENTSGDYNCVNCHSFPMQNPDKMAFHSRAKFPGTLLIDGGKVVKLNTKTPETIATLTYPYWHPSGDFIAYSTNIINQTFHSNHPNRIEVFDSASDVVVYDVKKNVITSCDLIKSDSAFETFPTFSPDGKSLYYCSSPAVSSMPDDYEQAHYSLCRIDFNPADGSFGSKVDTLFHAGDSLSVSFPRVSPDGKQLVFTLHHFGNFSIWHHEADLYQVDMSTGAVSPMTEANSADTDSYHSWSHNSRWMIFSSRRIDGLYTRPFITYVDGEGRAHKPFLLPQKNPKEYYQALMYSYNIPELLTGKVEADRHEIVQVLKNSKGIDLSYQHK